MTVQNADNHCGVVMIVDDEEMVTRSLNSMLQLDTDYTVVTFNSPTSALDYLKTQAVDIVVSDFLMPEMDGLKFLSESKKIHPLTPRVLLTGYADKENAIKGINEVGLYHYMEKPWDNSQLLLTIKNGIASKGLQVELKQQIKALDLAIRQKNELSERHGELTQEMAQARQLQFGMLPSTMPTCTGFCFGVKYEPALDIGGDFYDVIRLSDTRYAVLIADATGHGIQAALCTALVKFAFGSVAVQTESASEILSGMNTILHGSLPVGVFVAAMVAVVAVNEGHVTLANGGLPHPLVVREGGEEIERLPAEGLLLGVAPGSSYSPSEEYSVNLIDGESLLLFTDGLTEAGSGAGRFFEQDGLLNAVKETAGLEPSALASALGQRALEFGAGASHIDDLTILAIKKVS